MNARVEVDEPGLPARGALAQLRDERRVLRAPRRQHEAPAGLRDGQPRRALEQSDRASDEVVDPGDEVRAAVGLVGEQRLEVRQEEAEVGLQGVGDLLDRGHARPVGADRLIGALRRLVGQRDVARKQRPGAHEQRAHVGHQRRDLEHAELVGTVLHVADLELGVGTQSRHGRARGARCGRPARSSPAGRPSATSSSTSSGWSPSWRSVTVWAPGAPVTGSAQCTRQAMASRLGSTPASQRLTAGSASERGVGSAAGGPSPGCRCRPTRCVSVTPVGGVRTTSGSGGYWPVVYAVERRADAVEVALHRLVDALGQREVGERVVDVEQAVDLRVDRGALPCRRPRGAWPRRTGSCGCPSP